MKTRKRSIVLLILLLNCFFFFSCVKKEKDESIPETKTIIAIEYLGHSGMFSSVGVLIRFDDGSSMYREGTRWVNGLKVGDKVVLTHRISWTGDHRTEISRGDRKWTK